MTNSVSPEEFFLAQCEQFLLSKDGVEHVDRVPGEYALLVHTFSGQSGTFFAHNAFAEARDRAPEDRGAVIERFTRWFCSDDESHSSWLEAAPRLRAVVRATSLALSSWAENSKPVLWRPLSVPFLNVFVVVDLGDSMRYVTMADVEAWAVLPDVVMERAIAQVTERAALALVPYGEADGGIFIAIGENDYTTSHLLRPQWLGEVAAHVKGTPVVCAPKHDEMLVCGAGDSAALERMAALASREYTEGPRPLSPALYMLGSDGQIAWLEPPEPRLAAPIIRGRVSLHAESYNEEKNVLVKKLEAAGLDLFVAGVMVVDKKDGSPPVTLCVWPQDVESLLPFADVVVFAGGPEGSRWHCGVPWGVATQLAGHLLTPFTEGFFQRFRTLGFPDPALMDKLRQHVVL